VTRRVAVFALVAAALVAVGVALVSDVPRADLIVVQEVPSDVQAEVDILWRRFVGTFGARRSCFGDVSLMLVRDVEGGDARYVGAESLIEIEIPTTPARFRESLAHELGHHVERTCIEFSELRAAMLTELDMADSSWSGGDVWEQIPAEIWAEGVVGLVNGERILHGDDMPIDPSITALIEAWARGDDLADVSG